MRILIQAGAAASLLNFRGSLISTMLEMGHEVVCVAPPASSDVRDGIEKLGASLVPVHSLQRAGLNPYRDYCARREISAIIRRQRPNLVLAYTIKPIVLGIPAARAAGVACCYPLITGLGAAFNTLGLKGWGMRFVATRMYRSALRVSNRVIVQNADIAEFLLKEGIVTPSDEVRVVPGSGVDLNHFQEMALPQGNPCFLLLGRMLFDKGVREFVAAARVVKKLRPAARFLLVGDIDPNPAAISAATLAEWNKEGVVEYRPSVSDVRPLLAECTAYVLPSYHEGMPRSVLEAMATGRPVITTDTIGCKETIINAGPQDGEGVRTGENGMLVPVRNVESLAVAMLRLANDTALGEQMGSRGRQLAEQQFDVRLINQQMLQAMDLLPPGAAGLSGTATRWPAQ